MTLCDKFISIYGSSFMTFPAPTSSTNVALIGITKALLTLLSVLITYCFFSCVYPAQLFRNVLDAQYSSNLRRGEKRFHWWR